MRLMIGSGSKPSLLVSVDDPIDSECFEFFVINGAWSGVFTHGHITVLGCPSGDFSSLDQDVIMCQNQDRLRGDYGDVFANYHDEHYIAPKALVFNNTDDDVPF